MKNLIFMLIAFLLLGCSRDNTESANKLPPETQTGANTFGVTIKGKVYIPRDPTGIDVGVQLKAVMFWGAPSGLEYKELVVLDGASAVGFKIWLHIEPMKLGPNVYSLKQSNFQDGIDSIRDTHIYFKIWDPAISNYAYYGSIENQGQIRITRRSDGIISGTFGGKFAKYDNTNDTIEITDGRFDINTNTVMDHPFP
jgi:hypothetical protein